MVLQSKSNGARKKRLWLEEATVMMHLDTQRECRDACGRRVGVEKHDRQGGEGVLEAVTEGCGAAQQEEDIRAVPGGVHTYMCTHAYIAHIHTYIYTNTYAPTHINAHAYTLLYTCTHTAAPSDSASVPGGAGLSPPTTGTPPEAP
jgi:hypothetical protein